MASHVPHAPPQDWYDMSAMRRTGVAVMLRWGWFEGRAVLLRKRKGAGFFWATIRDGAVVRLPEGAGRDWPPEPACWSPIGPWPDPLPDPLRFSVRDDTASPDPICPEAGSDPFRPDVPWWFEPRPQWIIDDVRTREAVEYRLMRSVAQLERLDAPGMARSRIADGFKSTDEAASELVADLFEPIVPRFRPTRTDIDDFVVAQGWFTALSPPEMWSGRRRAWSFSKRQMVLFYRSRSVPHAFQEIADRLRMRSEALARYYYTDSIERCFNFANGRRAYRWIEPRTLRTEAETGGGMRVPMRA